MSTKYKAPSDVPNEALVERVEEIVNAITRPGRDKDIASELTMRIPAECDRDADIVLTELVRRFKAAVSGWRDIASAPDGLHIRGIWFTRRPENTRHFETHVGYVDDDGDFVSEFGDDYGWPADEYSCWQPLPDGGGL